MEVIIIILLILALAMVVGSILGFGDSLIIIPLTALFIDVRIAVVLAAFWSMLLSTINSIKYRDHIDKLFVKKHIGPGILGVIIGSLLIIIAPLRWIEFSLGIFIMVFLIAKICEIRKEGRSNSEVAQELIDINSLHDALFYTGAFSYGFLAGLIGASGPINVVLLEKTGHERESFIANFAFTSVIVNSFRLIVYVGSGLFPIEYLIVLLLGFIVIIVTTRFGHWLTPKIPKKKFNLIILMMLLIISLKLIITTLFFY